MDGQVVAGNHRSGVNTKKHRRQSRECVLEEQTRSRAAFSHVGVSKKVVEFFDHHVDRNVTATDFERLPRTSRRLRRKRRSWQHQSDRAKQTSETNDLARQVEKCDGDKEVNSENLKSNHAFIACNCYYTRAHYFAVARVSTCAIFANEPSRTQQCSHDMRRVGVKWSVLENSLLNAAC